MEGHEDTDELLRLISELPEKLSEMYSFMLNQLSKEDKSRALRVSRWVTFSKPAMRLCSLLHAAAIEPDGTYNSRADVKKSWPANRTDIQFFQDLKRLSGGFIILFSPATSNKTSNTVPHRARLIGFDHESVYEYMRQDGIGKLHAAVHPLPNPAVSVAGHSHHLLSIVCVKYLRLREVGDLIVDITATIEARYAAPDESNGKTDLPDNLPFLRDAVRLWFSHARRAEVAGIGQQDLLKLTNWPNHELCTNYNTLRFFLDPPWLMVPHMRSTLLHQACIHGLRSILDQLLATKTSTCLHSGDSLSMSDHAPDCWQTLDERERTPLLLAVKHKHRDMVTALLRVDSGVDVVDTEGYSALWYAASQGSESLVGAILKAGGRVHWSGPTEGAPFAVAAEHGDWDIVKLLQKHGLDINATGCTGSLIQTAARYGNLDILQWLIFEQKANPRQSDDHGMTVLHEACQEGHTEVVQWLLAKTDVDVHARTTEYFWWTHRYIENDPASTTQAASGTLADLKRALWDYRFKPDLSPQGKTPLHLAAKSWVPGCIVALREHGHADINAHADRGRRPLHCLFEPDLPTLTERKGNFDDLLATLEALLLTPGVAMRAKDSCGTTPLMAAALDGPRITPGDRTKVVSILLDDHRTFEESDTNDLLARLIAGANVETIRCCLEKRLAPLSTALRAAVVEFIHWYCERSGLAPILLALFEEYKQK